VSAIEDGVHKKIDDKKIFGSHSVEFEIFLKGKFDEKIC
jgi:hypothetical protein